MDEVEWHGWGLADKSVPALHIGRLPGRKSVCLYMQHNGVIDTLAFFRDETTAKQALIILDQLMRPLEYR
jgi:hypothetical protein